MDSLPFTIKGTFVVGATMLKWWTNCPHIVLQMLLLDAMTDHLGDFELWPTYILQQFFIDRPGPTHTSRLRKVIAFLYGNDLPLRMAYTFYNACCGCTGATARFVVEQTREWYCECIVQNFGVTLLNIITCFSNNFITLTVPSSISRNLCCRRWLQCSLE